MSESPKARTISSDQWSEVPGQKQNAGPSQTSKKHKRVTLTLPLQPDTLSVHTPVLTSPIRFKAPSLAESDIATKSLTTPVESDFLTAIAAQERRVLELKEELLKAEQALSKLKKDWAIQEVHKKRQELRKLRHGRSGSETPVTEGPMSPEYDGQPRSLAQELERRKAMHLSSKPTGRTVFSGSKHARTLSLLTPDAKPMSGPSLASPSPDRQPPFVRSEVRRTTKQTRVAQGRVVSGEMQRTSSDDSGAPLDMSREVLLKAGRQMATDFKDGLWTFLEDLRQVTVGEDPKLENRSRPGTETSPSKLAKDRRPRNGGQPEGTGARPRTQVAPRRRPNESHLIDSDGEPSPKDSAIGSDRAQLSDKEIEINVQQSPIKRKSPRRRSGMKSAYPRAATDRRVDGEGWDTWESPREQPRAERIVGQDTDGVVQTHKDFQSLLDGSLEEDHKRDPIPWPALVSLAPSSLRRTASHLMSELERSISPQRDRVRHLSEDEPGGPLALTANPKQD